ncbi:MAG TPA: guanylate kinase [Blastocatellia bacterium]|jgi:guanylate kinase
MSSDDRALKGSPGEAVAESITGEPRRSGAGRLIVVSAPSGAGKSSLVEIALQRVERLKYSISYTTRKARGQERDKVDYYFVTESDFIARRNQGEFLECAEVHGQLYGTHRSMVEEMTEQGYDVILDIDVQGAEQIRRQMPEAVTVFIMPPSREVLETRLRARNDNEPADLERRLKNATMEVKLHKRFDYVIINDDLKRAADELEAIITAERMRPSRQRERIEEIMQTFGEEVFHA